MPRPVINPQARVEIPTLIPAPVIKDRGQIDAVCSSNEAGSCGPFRTYEAAGPSAVATPLLTVVDAAPSGSQVTLTLSEVLFEGGAPAFDGVELYDGPWPAFTGSR